MEKTPMKPAAIYARVSSNRQKEEHTIASQSEALRAFALQQGFRVPDEWVFEDEGYSGATLIRPGLEKVRDLAAEGQIDAVLVHPGIAQDMPTGGLCRMVSRRRRVPADLWLVERSSSCFHPA
jgi:resolvase-like protein